MLALPDFYGCKIVHPVKLFLVFSFVLMKCFHIFCSRVIGRECGSASSVSRAFTMLKTGSVFESRTGYTFSPYVTMAPNMEPNMVITRGWEFEPYWGLHCNFLKWGVGAGGDMIQQVF